jgi:hypothetical protein
VCYALRWSLELALSYLTGRLLLMIGVVLSLFTRRPFLHSRVRGLNLNYFHRQLIENVIRNGNAILYSNRAAALLKRKFVGAFCVSCHRAV